MNKAKAIEERARKELKEFVIYQVGLMNGSVKQDDEIIYKPKKTEGTWFKKIVINQKHEVTFYDGFDRPSDWEDISWEELFDIATWLEETFHDECKTRCGKDYVIINSNGMPLTFNTDSETIIVYGDKEEAKADMEKTDLGLMSVEYEKANPNTAIIKDFNEKEIGIITFDRTDENDFQKKLYDFIVVYDFLSHTLPH